MCALNSGLLRLCKCKHSIGDGLPYLPYIALRVIMVVMPTGKHLEFQTKKNPYQPGSLCGILWIFESMIYVENLQEKVNWR